MGKFHGFSNDTIRFLREIAANNNKTWFEEHKALYRDEVEVPAKLLASDLFRALTRNHSGIQVHTRVSRIYKDFRRVKDGRYYNDAFWVITEDINYRYNGLCLFFKTDGYTWRYGLCLFGASGKVMADFRSGIDRDRRRAEHILLPYTESERFILEGEFYKRTKLDEEHPLAQWYNRRGISLVHREAVEAPCFMKRELTDVLMDGYEELMPLYVYLAEILGEGGERYDY